MENVNKMLSWTFTNKNIKYLLLGVGLLSILLKKLPPNNIISRIIFILFILYFSNHDLQLTMMLVIIFLLSLNKNKIEHFDGNQLRPTSKLCGILDRNSNNRVIAIPDSTLCQSGTCLCDTTSQNECENDARHYKCT